jgi:hypothetical protein
MRVLYKKTITKERQEPELPSATIPDQNGFLVVEILPPEPTWS